MRAGAIDHRLGGDWEARAVLMFGGFGDFGGVARLLSAEIVGRHADDQQAAVAIARPQVLQSSILRGVAALAGGVDDQDRLTGMLSELDGAAPKAGHGV